MKVANPPTAHCPRHELDHDPTEACPGCVADPNPPAAQGLDCDEELLERERDLAAEAKWLRGKARSLCDERRGDDGLDFGAAAKLYAESVRFERLAFEMREIRKSREHDLKILRHENELRGLGVAH